MIRHLVLAASLVLSGAALAQPAQQRAGVAIAAASSAETPVAPASRRLQLRPDLMHGRDIVSFGDLIVGLPAQHAAIAAFRAPGLGETGTIQVARIVEAARAQGLIASAAELDSQGLAQVVVTRAARRLVAADIEDAVKTGLMERFGVDGRAYALSIDGGAPAVAVEPELTGAMAVLDLSYDVRSRRLQARLTVPGSAALRLKPIHVAGQLVETVEVIVPRRAIARGETLGIADVMVERRPRDGLSTDFIADVRAAADKVARRALAVGLPLRAGDVQREEIVGRGDLVTIVYETPGLLITTRGRADAAGAIGDVISITNPQSKRTLQATVSGPARVTVTAANAGRVASLR